MGQKMTWNEIKTSYPDQWVSLENAEFDVSGEVVAGIVIGNDPDLKNLTKKSKGDHGSSHRFEYTGEIKDFLGFAKWDIGHAHTD